MFGQHSLVQLAQHIVGYPLARIISEWQSFLKMLERYSYQVDEPLIINLLLQHLYRFLQLYAIKEMPHVGLQEIPELSFYKPLHLSFSVVRATFWHRSAAINICPSRDYWCEYLDDDVVYPLFPYVRTVYPALFSVFVNDPRLMLRRVECLLRVRNIARSCVPQHFLHLFNAIVKVCIDILHIFPLCLPFAQLFPRCPDHFFIQAFPVQIFVHILLFLHCAGATALRSGLYRIISTPLTSNGG